MTVAAVRAIRDATCYLQYTRNRLGAVTTTIRQIRIDEWDVLRQVRLAAVKDAPAAFSESLADVEAMSDEEWQGRAARGAEGGSSFCALAFAQDQAIGMAVGVVDRTDSSYAYLVAVWVAPAHRGTDAAPSLVSLVIQWALSRGVAVVFAGVLKGNARAAVFYHRVGFTAHLGPIPAHPIAQGAETLLSRALSARETQDELDHSHCRA